MKFAEVLTHLQNGEAVARTGWNGKGMFIYQVHAGRYAPTTKVGEIIASTQEDGLVPYRPYLAIKTVDNDVVPWVASQTDLLAFDWDVVELEEAEAPELVKIVGYGLLSNGKTIEGTFVRNMDGDMDFTPMSASLDAAAQCGCAACTGDISAEDEAELDKLFRLLGLIPGKES